MIHNHPKYGTFLQRLTVNLNLTKSPFQVMGNFVTMKSREGLMTSMVFISDSKERSPD